MYNTCMTEIAYHFDELMTDYLQTHRTSSTRETQTTYSDLLRPTQTYSRCPEDVLTQEGRIAVSGCLVDSVSQATLTVSA